MSDEFGFNQQPDYQQPNSQQQASYAPPAGGYAPPAGGNVPPAGYYAPPAGGYAPYRAKAGKGGGWIGFLRVFLWIWFGLICLFGLVAFIGMSSDGEAGIGLLCLLASVLVAFLSVAGGMIALDACANISRCATNSARILELLQAEKK